MKRKIKSTKSNRLTLKQVFFFNGSKLTMEVVDGEGFVEFDEEKINADYLEKSILERLHLAFAEEAKDEEKVDTEEPEKEAQEETVVEEKEEAKPKTKKKTTSNSKKRSTTRKKTASKK